MASYAKLGVGLFLAIVSSNIFLERSELYRASEPFFSISLGYKAVFAVVVLAVLALYYKESIFKLPQTMLWAGFVGNCATFILLKDFVDVIPTGFSYINTADLVIGIGCILFLWRAISYRRET